MLHARQDLAFGRAIALQFISNDHSRDVLQPFEKLAEELFCGVLAASALHQNIKHVAILINSSPQIVGFAVDFQVHLVHMPCISAARTATAQLVGIHLPKLKAPLTHSFIRHDDSALCQKLFDIAKTERETEIDPNSVPDNFRWEAKAFVAWSRSICFHAAILAYCSATSPS